MFKSVLKTQWGQRIKHYENRNIFLIFTTMTSLVKRKIIKKTISSFNYLDLGIFNLEYSQRSLTLILVSQYCQAKLIEKKQN